MKAFVIGAGSIGKRHYSNLLALGIDAQLIEWRSIDLKALYLRLQEVDNAIVIIATSTNIRLEIIDLCVDLNVPMYIEKPLAFKKNDLDKIYSMPVSLQKKSAVGFMMRYHPILIFLLSKKNLTYEEVKLSIKHDINQWRSNWDFASSYASKSDGGGVLLDLCHEIDIAYLLDSSISIKSVRCYEHKFFKKVDLDTRIILNSKNIQKLEINMDYLSKNPIRNGLIKSKKDLHIYDLIENTLQINNSRKTQTLSYNIERNDLFLDIMHDFLLNLSGKTDKISPIFPSLDIVKDISYLISLAWQEREFIGFKELN